MRTILCDTRGCLSYCELDPKTPDEAVNDELAIRGWTTVTLDGQPARHYCQAHFRGVSCSELTPSDREKEPATGPACG